MAILYAGATLMDRITRLSGLSTGQTLALSNTRLPRLMQLVVQASKSSVYVAQSCAFGGVALPVDKRPQWLRATARERSSDQGSGENDEVSRRRLPGTPKRITLY